MSVLHLVFSGPPEQKQTIKLTAMQPISAALADVCSKFKPALDASSIALTLNKKPVDITCPFRLANIPAGSILHISAYKYASAAAGLPDTTAPATQHATPSHASASTQPAAASQQPTPPATAAPPSTSTQIPVTVKQEAARSTVDTSRAAATPATQTPTTTDAPSQSSVAGAGIMQSPADVDMTCAADNDTKAAATAPAPTSPTPVDFTLVCKVLQADHTNLPARDAVFTTEAGLQSATVPVIGGDGATGGSSSMQVDGEEDDSFFELTPEDLMRISQAKEAKRKEENMFKTQAMREAEERARLQGYGPVAVRIRLGEGLVVQAAFKASDTLQVVKDFVQALLPGIQPSQLALFTTPPKQVLKDLSVALYKAGLVPACWLHCQITGIIGKSIQDLLHPGLKDCCIDRFTPGVVLPGQHAHEDDRPDQSRAAARQEQVDAAAAQRQVARSLQAAVPTSRQGADGGEGATKKLPKWFKPK